MSTTSVVITCPNLGEFLPEAIESVQRQTLPPSELIVVDEASTDAATIERLNACREAGLSVLRTSHPGGAAARNVGIERATGDYVVCLEADSVLLPTMLEELVLHLDRLPRVGIVSPWNGLSSSSNSEATRWSVLWQNGLASESLFRKQCWRDVGGFHDLPAHDDWEFWISAIEKGWEWLQVPQSLVRQRTPHDPRVDFAAKHRRSLLKRIVALHNETYRTHIADLFVGLDAALRAERSHLREYVEANGEREKRLASLRKSLQERNRQIAELEAAEDKLQRMANEWTKFQSELQGKLVEST